MKSRNGVMRPTPIAVNKGIFQCFPFSFLSVVSYWFIAAVTISNYRRRWRLFSPLSPLPHAIVHIYDIYVPLVPVYLFNCQRLSSIQSFSSSVSRLVFCITDSTRCSEVVLYSFKNRCDYVRLIQLPSKMAALRTTFTSDFGLFRAFFYITEDWVIEKFF